MECWSLEVSYSHRLEVHGDSRSVFLEIWGQDRGERGIKTAPGEVLITFLENDALPSVFRGLDLWITGLSEPSLLNLAKNFVSFDTTTDTY